MDTGDVRRSLETLMSEKAECVPGANGIAEKRSCPCGKFRTIHDVANATIVKPSDSTSSPTDLPLLIDWLSHGNKARSDDDAPGCCSENCSNRGRIALCILNAVRDACQPFLNEEENGKESPPPSPATKTPYKPQSYEESFPTLQNTQSQTTEHPKKVQTPSLPNNVLSHQQPHPKNKPSSRKGGKTKRRIRPATLQTAPLSSGRGHVWGQPSQFSSAVHFNDSTNKESPLPATSETSHLLEKRLFGESSSSTTKQVNDDGAKSSLSPSAEQVSSSAASTNQESSKLDIADGAKDGATSHPPVLDDIESLPSLHNIVRVYHAMIQASLVPSTALEIHLMIRLLTVKFQANRAIDKTLSETAVENRFNDVFCSSSRCILFARNVLERLANRLVGFGLARSLESCPPVKLHCPGLIHRLHVLKRSPSAYNNNQEPETPTKSPPKHRTALFTLPFDPNRDSRHNFRSANEQAVFKNRENARDLFLNQLRAYYNRNSSASQIEHDSRSYPTSQLRQAVRSVMDTLEPENMSWFADFFRDLLLQLGPVPVVREADQELLRIADSDTLQKLHQRLYSKVPTNSKSKASKKSSQSFSVKQQGKRNTPNQSSSTKNAKSSQGILEQALKSFKGYQEFFFLFVITADSFHLGRHLLGSFLDKLKERLHRKLTIDDALDHRVSELQLLSKVIGVLLFSPYWSEPWTESKIYPTHDPLRLLQLHGISLEDVLEDAKSVEALVLTLPWVVDLLKMARWDPTTSAAEDSTTTYGRVLSLLRSAQVGLNEESFPSSTFAFLSSCLESLFHETVGLVRASTLTGGDQLPKPQSDLEVAEELQWDHTAAPIPRQLLYSVDGHIEDLVDLISILSRPTHRKNPSRKLRPIQLKETSRVFESKGVVVHQGKGAGEVPTITRGRDEAEGQNVVKAKLRDIFFHEHPQLKEIGTFAVGQILQTIGVALEKSCGKFTEENHDRDEGKEPVRIQLLSVCNQAVDEIVRDRLAKSFDCLASSQHSKAEKDTAYSLFQDQAHKQAQPIVRSHVATALKAYQDQHEKVMKTTKESAEKSHLVKEEKSEVEDHDVDNLLDSVKKRLVALTQAIGALGYQLVLDHISRTSGSLDLYITTAKEDAAMTPPTDLLRDVYQAILDLDDRVGKMLRTWMKTKDKEFWHVLVGLVELAIQISHISRHGLASIVACLSNPTTFSSLKELADDGDCESTFISILVKLVRARLLALGTLLQGPASMAVTGKVLQAGKVHFPAVDWDKLQLLAESAQ